MDISALISVTSAMEHSYLDEYSSLNSFIHRLEPRIKIIVFFAFVFFTVLAPPGAFFVLKAYAAIIAVFMLFSRIPLLVFLKRSSAALPFILGMSLFILFMKPGRPLWGYSLGTLRLSITYEGLAIFFSLVVKAYLCIFCMLLLILSTNFPHLLKALEKLKAPSIFIMIISFMYRYLFILQDELEHMRQAKESRTVGGSRWFQVKVLANMLGVLFIRAYERAERVYSAMSSRGFNGQIKTVDDFRIGIKDFGFLAAMLFIISLIRFLGG